MGTEGQIRVAFVGLGRIASLLEDDPLREKPATHAGAAAANERCTIAGGTDTDNRRRELFRDRWNTAVFPSASEMIQETRPGIVVIATHPDSHLHYLQVARKFNVPVVICEKPIAHRYKAARIMAAIEAAGGIRVVVNHERRFSKDYILTRDAVADGRFGALVAVQGRLFFGFSGRHDRVFLHDGTHMVDAVHFLTGDTVDLRRKIGTYRTTQSSVFLHGRTRAKRVPVVLEVGARRRYLHFEIVLSFEDGEIRVGNGVFQWYRGAPSPHYSSYRSLTPLHRFPPRPSGYFSGMLSEAVRLFDNPEALSRSSLQDGLSVMRVIRKAGLLW